MIFSVIYSVDTFGSNVKLKEYMPPKRHLWDTTESDDNTNDYGEIGKHRKLCAILTKEQFREFVDHCFLYAEDIETMGSLGAPGCGFGWAPAISFSTDDSAASCNAYVTPLCCKQNGEPIRLDGSTERDWRRLRRIMIKAFS